MRALVVVLVLLVGCSNKRESDTGSPNSSACADELRAIVVPALKQSLAGGNADAFQAATDKFTHGTMCGPDIAAMMRDWESALREPDAAKSTAQRRDILARLKDLVSSQPNYSAEAHALEPVFASANAGLTSPR